MSVQVAERLVTRREAAEIAGVHVNTVRLWERTGRVHPQKDDSGSGVVMIPLAEIEAIVEARREHSLDGPARAAALETENRMLREQLDETKEELRQLRERYQQFTERVMRMAEGSEGSSE